jgi:multiple sugar transport system permease protein
MPLISTIGRRSWKVKATLGAIYFVLIVGAISMVYPLLLMLAGSAKSETDFQWIGPVPQYLWDDGILWMKYIESKYALLPYAEAALRHPIGSWRTLRPPTISSQEQQLVDRFRQFRDQFNWPREWYSLGHTQADRLMAKNARAFKKAAEQTFHGDIAAYSRAAGIAYPSFSNVGPPMVPFAERRFSFPSDASYRIYYDLKARCPRSDWVIVDIDGQFYRTYLTPVWSTIESYNKAHGTKYSSYSQVTLATVAPLLGQSRIDWEEYVRNDLSLVFIRFDGSLIGPYRQFLQSRYPGIAQLNSAWVTAFTAFDQIPLPQGLPENKRAQVDLSDFLKNRKLCPAESLRVEGPRQAFERFIGSSTTVPLPTEAVDWADFQEQKPALRWEFLTRNYKTVWDYIAGHGNGIRNTFIFCALLVLTNLIINPLAAYALSRYKPPSAYKILLFCMATMAFPAEVTMIPSFLLLKQMSLLNTFWALVLPGAANGFSIFLLKGFFDSLPQELYEAADIDGAGEWTKFWLITMNLSKPILAVLALGAFTAAYTEFMMALVIIPDPNMWTLMVWLYQLQHTSHPSVVYASLVIAAVPTMLIFLLCQNLIMRGIVVPVEK